MADSPPSIFRRHCVLGAPVSCLSLSSKSICVYGQGGWLERRALCLGADGVDCDGQTNSLPGRYGSQTDRILALDDSSVHGIRYSPHQQQQLSAVFGGNQIAFLQHVLDLTVAMLKVASLRQQGDHHEVSSAETFKPSSVLVLSDWIWDCQWQSDDGLVVGLAHNKVQLWEISFDNNDDAAAPCITATCLRQVSGQSKTISYCMHIHDGLVAVGLPLRDILVWSMDDDDDDDASSKEACLQGHQGCIHTVRFKDQNMLASASDDRTVRLWERDANNDWTLKWTAFGHAARCWSLEFAALGIVSTGEDQTARLWDEGTGAQLAVLRGHGCHSIWRVDTLGHFVVTGANDGSVAVYDLRHQIRRQRSEVTDLSACSWETTILVPNCSGDTSSDPSPLALDQVIAADARISLLDVHASTDDEAATKKKKVFKVKEKAQALVGLQFCSSTGSTPQLIVATRRGVIWIIAPETGTSRQVATWWDPSFEAYGISATDGCCFSVCPSGTRALVGTTKGYILLSELSSGHGQSVILSATDHRAVQRVAWLSPSAFLSLHTQTIVMWTRQAEEKGAMRQFSTYQAFRPNLKGMPICFCCNESQTLLVTGDTRGHLALFKVSLSGGSNTETYPLSTVRAHGRDHVTAILWVQDRVLSVGNDGCIHECVLDDNCQLIPLKSVTVPSFTGLDRLWWAASSKAVLVGGYFGNVYAVVDAESGYELLRVDTGGRQRSCCLRLDLLDALQKIDGADSQSATARSTKCWFAFSGASIDGGKQIQLSCSNTLGNCHAWKCARASPMHGDVIFSSCLFAMSEDTFCLVTASEDCYSRMTCFRHGVVLTSELLPGQAGGARALCHSRLASISKTLVVAGGGKLELQFYVIDDYAEDISKRQRVEQIGRGFPSEKASIDHRINAIAAIEHPNGHCKGAIVAAGDSNGRIYCYQPSVDHRGSLQGCLIHAGERPVLSLAFIKLGNKVLLLVGTSDGNVSGFVISEVIDVVSIKKASLFVYRAHQVGTNAVSARVIRNEMGSLIVRVCSGGDDQSIYCCDIACDSVSESFLGTRRHMTAKGGASAVRGLAFMDDSHVVTCGYDRQLRLFDVSGNELICQLALPVALGDINCLSYVTLGISHIVAVGGAGIELYSLPPP